MLYNPGASHAQSSQAKSLIKAARRIPHRRGFVCMADVEDEPWSEAQLEIRKIGRRLFIDEGSEWLRDVWDRVYAEDMQAAQQVANAWEGIGRWFR
jgi:hypothetical protein